MKSKPNITKQHILSFQKQSEIKPDQTNLNVDDFYSEL